LWLKPEQCLCVCACACVCVHLCHTSYFVPTPVESSTAQELCVCVRVCVCALCVTQSYFVPTPVESSTAQELTTTAADDNKAAAAADNVRVLSQINVFPVKSCGPMVVTEWPIGPRGLLYDR